MSSAAVQAILTKHYTQQDFYVTAALQSRGAASLARRDSQLLFLVSPSRPHSSMGVRLVLLNMRRMEAAGLLVWDLPHKLPGSYLCLVSSTSACLAVQSTNCTCPIPLPLPLRQELVHSAEPPRDARDWADKRYTGPATGTDL